MTVCFIIHILERIQALWVTLLMRMDFFEQILNLGIKQYKLIQIPETIHAFGRKTLISFSITHHRII